MCSGLRSPGVGSTRLARRETAHVEEASRGRGKQRARDSRQGAHFNLNECWPDREYGGREEQRERET